MRKLLVLPMMKHTITFTISIIMSILKSLNRTIVSFRLLVILVAVVTRPTITVAMSLIDAANFAVRQSPTTTRFITNKMCPFAQKAYIALEVANAPYEMEEISLYGPNGKPDWFWKLNPKGEVPVLVCYGGAVILADSDVILDKICDVVEGGATLAPKDDKAKKQVESFRKTLNDFLPIGKKAVQGGNKSKMWSKLKELDSKIVGPYVCGDQVTVADCAGFPFVWRIESEFGPVEDQGCENLRRWLDTCQENPAFAKTIQGSWWWWW